MFRHPVGDEVGLVGNQFLGHCAKINRNHTGFLDPVLEAGRLRKSHLPVLWSRKARTRDDSASGCDWRIGPIRCDYGDVILRRALYHDQIGLGG